MQQSLKEVLQNITGMTLDSRRVQPGDLFIAIPGFVSDGRKYIKSAIAQGAVVILAEASDDLPKVDVPLIAIENLAQQLPELAQQFYHNPSQQLQLIGITGTNGKTSICDFLQQALNTDCGVIGTLTQERTTPDVISLQKQLAEFVTQKKKIVAMEVSSHGLEQDRVANLAFDIGVFTNLSRDHLDYHQTMEAYAQAKKKLFTDFQLKQAVINLDDVFGRDLLAAIPQTTHIWRYSLQDSDADVYARQCQYTLEGIEATIVTPWGEGQLHTQLLGDFNLQNVLAVITILGLCDMPLATILDKVKAFKPVTGRMQMFGGGDEALCVVDYAHTPDALQHALASLRAHCQNQLWCVFGCGGDRDRGKRSQMGQVANQYADRILVTDDNPRSEDPARIVNDIIKDLDVDERMTVEHDRETAIAAAMTAAQAGDIVLIAGKGHENYQIIGDNKVPFSDIDVVEELLT